MDYDKQISSTETGYISFSQFIDEVRLKLRNYMSRELQQNNYEIIIREKNDDYDIPQIFLSLYDYRLPDKAVPEYNAAIVYETYKRSGMLEKVIKNLAILMEKQYPKEAKQQNEKSILDQLVPRYVTAEQVEQEKRNGTLFSVMGNQKVMFYVIDNASDMSGHQFTEADREEAAVTLNELKAAAVRNLEKYYPPEVIPMEGENGTTYLFLDSSCQHGNEYALCSGELFSGIAESEDSSLAILPLSDAVLMAVPVNSYEDYQECREILEEINLYDEQELQLPSSIYDKAHNLILSQEDEIREALSGQKPRKRRLFENL